MRSLLLVVAALLLAAIAGCGSGGKTVETPPGGAGGFPPAGGSGGGNACDADGDGYQSFACGGDDCDDEAAATHPGADDGCDAVDSDCDGAAYENCGCNPGDMKACFNGTDAKKRNVGACHDGAQRCGNDGTWGPCVDEVIPAAEPAGCDGIDQDCDGTADSAACRGCGAGAVEVCGNGLDDDCDGTIDNASVCTLDCSAVDPRSPDAGALSCCGGSPPPAYSYACGEGGGLATCNSDQRVCLDLDGDPGTVCAKACTGKGCFCGRPGDAEPSAVPDCGFLTPCARIDCDGKQHQPCYGGPPDTLGKGICHGGFHSCQANHSWDTCEGQQLPADGEICGNHLDDDCDGQIDESDGNGRPCAGVKSCAENATEICGNGLDDDCDGFSDEGCAAPAGATQACYTGALITRGIGACKDGSQSEQDGFWSPCTGETLPAAEVCGDGLDSDCNGLGGPADEEDGACCVAATETCNGIDDDCDGLVDDGVLTHCGTCGGGCFSESVQDMSTCDATGRTCDQIAAFPLDVASVTIGAPKPISGEGVMNVFEQSYSRQMMRDVWGNVRVQTVSTTSGLVTRSIDIGDNPPNRILVTALDGSVWAAFGQAGFPMVVPAFLSHYGKNGNLVCKDPDVNVVSMTVDLNGDLWVVREGTANTYFLRKYDATRTGPPAAGTDPSCVPIDLRVDSAESTDVDLTSRGPIALDANGILWISNIAANTGGSPILRVDTLHPQQVDSVDVGSVLSSPGFSIIGPDEALYNYPSGTGNGGGWARIDVSAAFAGQPSEGFSRATPSVRGLDVGPDGTVWAALANDRGGFGQPPKEAFLGVLDLDTGSALLQSGTADTDQCNDVLVDDGGYTWLAVNEKLYRWDAQLHAFNVVGSLAQRAWVSPGSTSRPLKEMLRRRGRWSQVVDSGVYTTRWTELSWSSSAPVGTRVLAYVRFADKDADLDTTPLVCGPFETSPASLEGCSGGRRLARVEFVLTGAGLPAVSSFGITWDRN